MIKYINHISVEDYIMLRKSAGFTELSKRQAETALQNYAFLIAAEENDKTIGMARLVADGAYVAVIVDVIVLPEYQGAGIGRVMIERIVEYIESNMTIGEKVLVMLVAAKGKEGFYEKFGFVKRPNETYGAGMSQWISK